MYRSNFLKNGALGACLLWVGLAAAQSSAVLIYDDTKPAIKFAAGELKAALEQNSQFTVTSVPPSQIATPTAPVQVVMTTNGSIAGQPSVTGLLKEGYAIRRVTTGGITRWWVIGNDAPGAMYAGLDMADSVKIDGSLNNVVDKQLNPNLAVRGFKFNIPLDGRTPSYADDSMAAQVNTAEMWSLPYWQGFLDQMARSRLNSLSLWNRHPFPSMVKVPEYPKAALDNVMRKTGYLHGGGSDNGTLQTVKAITMDEKIKFWKDVMQYAQDRGVGVSIFTWNVHVYGAENAGYGLTDLPSNSATKDYLRKSVRSLINTYPLLAGIGVTAGENLELSTADKEKWVWDTYGQGYKDAVQDAKNPSSAFYNPARKINFIHRAHEVNVPSITSQFSQLPGYGDADSSLAFTYKYSQAHMHATTKPLFITHWLNDVPPGKKVTLEVRNDDFYNVRWGDPDFARAYLNNFPDRNKINGFLMGPDGYTWGREVVSKNPDSPRQQMIDKLWYNFMIWGHLAYDPHVANARFQALLGARYPEVPSSNLYSGLSSVSKILPLVTRFYWGDLDFRWYPEASFDDSGYQGVQSFIGPKYPPMSARQDGEAQLIMSVKDYANNAPASGRLTPVDVAAKLKQFADHGLQNVAGLNPGTNKDLKETLGDVKATAYLGLYYSEKILGAVNLYRYQKNAGDTAALQSARTHLQNSSNHWKQYAAQWSSQYLPQRLGRMNAVIDMVAIQASVDKDIPGGATIMPLPTNTPPTVSLTSPSASLEYTAPATLVLSASATDSNGIHRVEFLRDGVLVATERYAPYSVSLGSMGVGAYSFSARAVDSLGAVATSVPVNVTVQAAGAPPPTATHDITSLVLVNASNGAAIRTLQPNETISLKNLGVSRISIQALGSSGTKSVKFQSAPDGVSRVENSAPWAFLGNSGSAFEPWTPNAGTYSITATGFSASNASGTAGKPLSITVRVVP